MLTVVTAAFIVRLAAEACDVAPVVAVLTLVIDVLR